MTTTWHADAALLARYAADELDDAGASSVEAHLMACETCRAALAPTMDAARLDVMWAEVADRVDAPRPSIVERGLVRLGVREHAARLLAATPSLRVSWFAAEALVLGFAVFIADRAAGGPRANLATLLFLTTAAFLPVAGVAVAFGPRVDPTYEIGTAAPMRGYRLLLVRATAVLVTSLVLTSAAALALPGAGWTAVAWLLPSFGLTLGTLALATYVRPLHAVAAVGVAWVSVACTSGAVPTDMLAVFRPVGQVAFVLIIAVSALVLAHRRETFEEGIVT
jgi:Putative zinc-finger